MKTNHQARPNELMPANDERATSGIIALLLLASGFIGFYLGAFCFGTEQVSVQFAQVLTGVVAYPPGAAEGIIQRQAWNFPILLSALGLWVGLSEFTVSIIMSGLLGMLSFQALALFIFAINGRFWISVLAPLLLLYSQATNFGTVYPVQLLGTPSNNGALALSYVLVVIAMFGVGRFRVGALLLGMSPAWHLVWGGLMWVIVSLTWVIGNKKPWRYWLPALRWFLGGISITLIIFLVQRANTPAIPETDPEEIKRHLFYFIQYWDFHRRPANFWTPEIFLNIMGCVVCFFHLKLRKAPVPENLQFLFRLFLIAGLASLGFALATHIPLSLMPLDVVRAMPVRLLNLFVISYAALVLGIFTRKNNKGSEQIFAALLITVLIVAVFMPAWTRMLTLATLVAGGMGILLLTGKAAAVVKGEASPQFQTALRTFQAVVLIGFAFFAVSQSVTSSPHKIAERRKTSQKIYAEMKASEAGYLLVASTFETTQLFTRRYLLFDPSALDNLCYFPELAPAAAAILRDIYGISYFDPPVETRHTGRVWPPGRERGLWESWDINTWKRFRKQYSVVDVLVPAEWNLQLPLKFRTHSNSMYHIPSE